MFRSGITVGEGFLMLAEEERDAALKEVYKSVYDQTEEGIPASAAMRETGAFPEYMLRMTAVAEQTGAMESVFRGLAQYYDRQVRLRATVRSAVAYPLLLTGVVLAVFFVFLTEVLPVFRRVFDQIGAQMQPVAEAFLGFGLWLSSAKWGILCAVCAIIIAALIIRFVPALHEKSGAMFSRAFSRTKTGKKTAQARLASVLALTFSGTTNVEEALELAGIFEDGSAASAAVGDCAARVMNGESFSAAVSESGAFEPVYCRMLAIAERSGSVDVIMRDVARRAEEDMDSSIEKLVGRVEPVTVVVLSLFVGLLLLSVMLPLVGIMSAL